MVDVTLKNVKAFWSKGRKYYYHRPTKTRLTAPFGSSEFVAELERLNGNPEVAERVQAGTLGALITEYRGSPEFTELAPRTRADYQKVFDYLSKLSAHRVAAIDAGVVFQVRDAAFKKHKRRFANYVVTVLSLLLSWAASRDGKIVNPIAGNKKLKLRRPKGMPKANRRWTDDEVQIVMAEASPQLRLAVALAVCTGMREGDVAKFPWSGYVDGKIQGRAAKTGAPIWMPAHPMLVELLDATPRISPIVLVSGKGQPYTRDGFRGTFFFLIRRLMAEGKIQPGLTFHGLRTTTATKLAEAGCDTQTIMAITGHETEAMVALYTKEASKHGRATAAIEKLDFGRRE